MSASLSSLSLHPAQLRTQAIQAIYTNKGQRLDSWIMFRARQDAEILRKELRQRQDQEQAADADREEDALGGVHQ